jgi:hypothetical protein
MSLTGVPLIVVAMVATAVSVAATVLLWSRFGQWRYVTRIAGVLLGEVLIVTGVGLVANRGEQFYPSWEALGGRTGAAAAAVPQATGRLDRTLAAGPVRWQPPDAASWRLSGAPTLEVPRGYRTSRIMTYPVVLELRGRGRTPAPGAVTVTLPATARTTAASLASLPADLARDVRVDAQGWVVVAPAARAALADALLRAEPGRFAGLALVGARRPVRVAAAHLARSWTAAVAWASGQTAAPLTPPVVLPRGRRA